MPRYMCIALMIVVFGASERVVGAQNSATTRVPVDSTPSALVTALNAEQRRVRVSRAGWSVVQGHVSAVDSNYLSVRTQTGVQVLEVAAVDSVWVYRGNAVKSVAGPLMVFCGAIGGFGGALFATVLAGSTGAAPVGGIVGGIVGAVVCGVSGAVLGAMNEDWQLVFARVATQ